MRESIIRETCETAMMAALYPRTTISVIIQEMQDSGGVSYLVSYNVDP
jgi:ribonuclease PH